MQTIKKIIALSSAILMASSAYACAQDAEPVMEEPVVINAFTAADIDADGALSRDEFVAFVVLKADAGDVDYKGVKLSGEYDNAFNTKDYNADGLLTAEELKVHMDGSDPLLEPEELTEEALPNEVN